MEEYPKQIGYDGPRNLGGFYPGFHDLVEKLKIGLKFTMLAENIIQVEYPAELVWQIRAVNVDDTIYRLDFLLKGHEEDRVAFSLTSIGIARTSLRKVASIIAKERHPMERLLLNIQNWRTDR